MYNLFTVTDEGAELYLTYKNNYGAFRCCKKVMSTCRNIVTGHPIESMGAIPECKICFEK